ncbi:YciC family protein [Candidatus Pantoea carbekii]|uniref:YciC family protein n=1 Tax=Candidatus Pantoea carbekii TaxID=1235990 RepID=UPI0004B76A97|nr:YciC family protein [Candidatus Pantoea carbekii]AKC32062.1 hypothetical protein BMSBPS_0247 [Candidatus Pantoea carbekii]
MSITTSSLYSDTKNFFRNELMTILMLVLLTSLISAIIAHVLTYDTDTLYLLNQSNNENISLFSAFKNMSSEQQRMLLYISAVGTFIDLISNTILIGGMLSLISLSYKDKITNVIEVIKVSIPLLPKLSLQLFIITFLIQLGLALLVIPGIILMFLLSLSPVILAVEKTSIIVAIRSSIPCAWKYIKLISPAISLWMLSKITLIFLFSSSMTNCINVLSSSIILNIFGNTVSAVLTVYLYRLYILLRQKS